VGKNCEERKKGTSKPDSMVTFDEVLAGAIVSAAKITSASKEQSAEMSKSLADSNNALIASLLTKLIEQKN
jgi:methionyl-tRNA formyltransferase